MYIIGFNGPPHCGKDTLARLFREHMEQQGCVTPVIETSLSIPLRRVAYAMVGSHYDPKTADTYEEFKSMYFREFDCTGRELMIDISELFLKPLHGQDILTKMLIGSLPKGFDGLVLIRDSGFQCEIDPLVDFVGSCNFCVCQVFRPGFDSFHGDSREWVRHPDLRFELSISNTGTLDDLRTEAGRLYGRLVNQKGWKL